MGQRTLIAAVGPVGGATKLLWSDASLKKSSAEPLDVVADELCRIGMQPEAVDALVERTARATAKRRERVLDAAEKLRKACADDDLFEALVSGRAMVFKSAITGESCVILTKARHSTREPGGTFQSTEPVTYSDEGAPVRHGGAVHPALRRIAAQQARAKREPTNDEAKPTKPGRADEPNDKTYRATIIDRLPEGLWA